MRGVDTIGQCLARLRQQSTMQVYSVSNRSGDAVDISSSHQRAALAVLIDCTGLPARAGVDGQYELKRCGKGNCLTGARDHDPTAFQRLPEGIEHIRREFRRLV